MIESIGIDPPEEPLEHAVPFTEFARQLSPLSPGAHDPMDGLYEQPGITPGLPWVGGFAETVGLGNGPQCIGRALRVNAALLSFATLNQVIWES